MQDFDVLLKRDVTYNERLFTEKTHIKFVRILQLLCDLKSKQIFRKTDRQTLICRITTKLTLVSKGKRDLSKKKKTVKF